MSSRSHNVRTARLIILLLALALFGYLGYRYRGHLFSGFGWITEATGSKTAAALSIVLGLATLVCAFFWLIFPIVVYLGLKDLRRRTAELDQTTQRCIRLLAQSSAEAEDVKNEARKELRAR